MNLISVVIPAVGFDQGLRSCLESLIFQQDVNLEVWVVFNPRKPHFISENWPQWIHFIESKRGVNCARNSGLEKSTSDLVLFLDSDCRLQDPYHVAKLVSFINQQGCIAGVGGGYEVPAPHGLASKAYHYIQMDWLRRQIVDQEFRTSALIGGHMLLRKSMLQGLKFDENIIYGGSEREFFVRLAYKNAILYLDLRLNVIHDSEISKKDLLKKAKAQARGEKYIRRRHKIVPGVVHGGSSVRYIEKPPYDPEWAPVLEAYERVFSRYSGAKPREHSLVKRLLFSAIEHLNVSQSRSD